MKVLNSIAVWGREYAKIFVDYCLASQLAKNNIPLLARDHAVTYHIITTRRDGKWLRRQPSLRDLARHCRIEWDFFEDHGYDSGQAPSGPEGEKYSFLSILQNMSINKSLQHDVLVFNYADFVWSDGSLPHSVDMMIDGVDAVLSFCLPVDKQEGMRELSEFRRRTGSGARVLELPPRAGADIAIRCLHREARLRYWDAPAFTVTPTYLLWPVSDQGVIVRAYHQTVLALRVKASDPAYRNGIPCGSLDGYYTALLAELGHTHHAVNSDRVMVFSVYDTIVNSRIGGPSRQSWDGFDREASLRECLRGVVSQGQRRFALMPIEVRRSYDHPEKWEKVAQESLEIVEAFHETTDFDSEEYDRIHATAVSLEEVAQRWRKDARAVPKGDAGKPSRPASGLHRKLIVHGIDPVYRRVLIALAGSTGRRLKRLLGESGARRIRLAVERLLYRGGRGQPESSTASMPMVPVTLDEARALLSSHDWERLADRMLPFMDAFDLVPNVTISPRALALMRVGSLCEELISDISDMDELVRVLTTTELALRALIGEAPLWPEGHNFLGRNMWFLGRVEEAMACFAAGNVCLPKLAEAAGWDANGRVMLPRNCAHVIGLMGHIDAFVKHKILSGDNRPYYLVAPAHEVVNPVFLDYWKAYLHIESPPPELAAPSRLEAVYTVNWNWVMPQDEGALVHVHRGIARVQKRWHEEERESLLRLNFLHAEMLARQTAAWGMQPDDWFVCFHVRSAGFYTEQDGTAQHFRNTSIDDYLPAMKSVVDAGGWVIRMGDPSAPPLDLEALGAAGAKVIDYAHSARRSAELDVALCASCRLFVSSPSGLHTVAHAFGRPVCYVNYPMYAGFPWHPGEIFIPQRYYCTSRERVLTLSEIMSTKLVYADHHFILQRAGVELLHNTPTDIAETVREALHPDTYASANARRGERVRKEFDRLNNEHDLDISGRLGLHFASNHASELCPYMFEKTKRSRRKARTTTGEPKASRTKSRAAGAR